ncbi:MAG: alpha-D-glucose phosphate-specific phosphoglucomutase, partial [Planctomycetes bacterium]|nr:alpha-D-glucose phosphate-specific phosphoglucomutase [Planctomycetota bacterium]
MALSPLAGKPAPAAILIDVDRLLKQYAERKPDPADPLQRVAFGTSGHRGSPLNGSFNEAHIVAMTQAICEYRAGKGIDGPLYLGMDTHAVSAPAQRTAMEVLAGNGVEVFFQKGGGFTPTPVISHAILTYNRERFNGLADGIVITPSHNPPKDGGFKYNPPHGGPADVDVTKVIQDRANALIASGNAGVKRIPYERAAKAASSHAHDFVIPYVNDLRSVIDLDAIKAAGLKIGVDPLGGASVAYWGPIRELYEIDVTVVNPKVDPRFAFMTCDHDGQIRMDCSSPHAMANLIGLKDKYQIAFGNDADADRHGIVTPSAGLMNPNHYLAAAIHYLFSSRPEWRADAAVGKTLVSSSVIDRVAASLGRTLVEVPVGFKWFV